MIVVVGGQFPRDNPMGSVLLKLLLRAGTRLFVLDHRAHHPDVKEVYWHYRHGLLGESRITLREDIVVNASYRVGK